jgi:hypothetical protein
MKHWWGREIYIDECTRKERMGIIWLKAGFWKLRGIRRGTERGRYPLCLGEQDAKHILLKCLEMKQWRGEPVCSKWLNINDIAYRKTIIYTNVTKLHVKTIGKYVFKTKCKCKTKIKGVTTTPYSRCQLRFKMRKWTESRNSNGGIISKSNSNCTDLNNVINLYILFFACIVVCMF